MKTRFFNLISLISCVAMTMGCSFNEDIAAQDYEAGRIILDFSAVSHKSRATESNDFEAAVDQLDVFIFEADGTTTPPRAHYERIETSADRAVLNVRRSSFDEQKRYWVYLIANATASQSDLEQNIGTLADLKQMQQVDERIHITGLDIEGTPQRFLMDGVAYKGSAEPTAPSAIQLYDGNMANNTELAVTLRRAAAKIFVTIKRGENVTFSTENSYLAGYYIHNLPYSTPMIADVEPDAMLRSSDKTNNDYFVWGEDMITVTAYVYSHDFTTGSIMENRTTLVVDIPMVHNGNEYPNNYYQIPVSKSHILERNTLYAVTVLINAPGAEDISHPLEVEPLKYDTAKWNNITIDVGGQTDSPKFLNINREQMEMRYIDNDSTTLVYASSSDVTVTVAEAYYYNKMGNRINEQSTTLSSIKCSVKEGELTGNITISSPLPTNKTIRYIRLNVTNKDGFSRNILVEQYPLEYITNIQSWYSYRDDFKNDNTTVTTFEKIGSRETAVSLEMTSGINQRWTGGYTYHIGTTSSGFWRSKVVTAVNSDGTSTSSYYSWNSANASAPQTSVCERSTNTRMYHIRITSTSQEYKLGNPKLTADGFTDPSSENALLVSPSFMIASRLGYMDATSGGFNSIDKDSEQFRDIVRYHCSQYVEVYKDENGNTITLDDWRLPTAAELKIIMQYQGTKNSNADAIDYLLNAAYYWTASGRMYNDKEEKTNNSSNNVTSVRCIRDAIVKK